MSRRWTLFFIVGFLTIAADQATKVWSRHALPVVAMGSAGPGDCVVPDDVVSHRCRGEMVEVIPDIWHWRLSFNPGSAFGLFHSADGARWFLSVIGILAVGGMVWMLKKARPDQRALHWALALVAGGAVGNLIDRIYFGVVTDMVLWHWKTKEWPVFNVADVALVIGVGLMFLDISREGKAEKARNQAKAAAVAAARR